MNPSQSASFMPPAEVSSSSIQSFSWVPPAGAGAKPVPTRSLSWVPAGQTRGAAEQGPAHLLPTADADADVGCIAPALRFISASTSRQHPAKVNTGIVNADAVEEGYAHLGICDGVSGCHHLGIPPDELPRELLRSCRSKLLPWAGQRMESGTDGGDGAWITGLIEEAYDATQAHGATTLLLAALRGASLVSACLGDSALLVLRPCSFAPLRLRTVFRTEPGRYDARRPVQVQRLHGLSDAHAHAVIQGAAIGSTPVRHGDLVVLGTDGLFDNLGEEDIRRTLELHCFQPGAAPAGGPWGTQRRPEHAGRLDIPSFMEPDAQIEAHPDAAQLRQAAAALVSLAILRVKLDASEPATRAPWSSQEADVPANNADDTTAIVASIVRADSSEMHESETYKELLGSCGLATAQPESDDSRILRDSTNTISADTRAPLWKRPAGLVDYARTKHQEALCEVRAEECAIS